MERRHQVGSLVQTEYLYFKSDNIEQYDPQKCDAFTDIWLKTRLVIHFFYLVIYFCYLVIHFCYLVIHFVWYLR